MALDVRAHGIAGEDLAETLEHGPRLRRDLRAARRKQHARVDLDLEPEAVAAEPYKVVRDEIAERIDDLRVDLLDQLRRRVELLRRQAGALQHLDLVRALEQRERGPIDLERHESPRLAGLQLLLRLRQLADLDRLER